MLQGEILEKGRGCHQEKYHRKEGLLSGKIAEKGKGYHQRNITERKEQLQGNSKEKNGLQPGEIPQKGSDCFQEKYQRKEEAAIRRKTTERKGLLSDEYLKQKGLLREEKLQKEIQEKYHRKERAATRRNTGERKKLPPRNTTEKE